MTTQLQITDNQRGDSSVPIANCVVNSEQFDLEKVKQDLEIIANVTIGKKVKNNPNLLVFPCDLEQYGDEISDDTIISLNGDKISTGNIMGFVGVNDTQLDIKSRFVIKPKKDEHLNKEYTEDYFLHYMLQKVFAINLFDIPHTSNQEQIFDFLLYLFPYYLKKALAQGLFKKYRSFERNDANIRGTIDVSRHIRQNIPFRGTVAYTVRTHSYDNEITQLIRHTIEYIKTKPYGSSILNNDAETKRSVTEIISATQTYKQQDRAKIIGENLRPVRHPYFAAYTDLQKICLQILRHETTKYGQEKDKVYGILFDGAWLWEEYLATFLIGFEHPKNKTGEGRKYLFIDNSVYCYPDFYNKNIVLDAKYKGYSDWSKVKNEDLYQVISYMHILNLQRGGFIVPKETNDLKPKTLNGIGGEMQIFGMTVNHQCKTLTEFAKKMKEEENKQFEYVSIQLDHTNLQ